MGRTWLELITKRDRREARWILRARAGTGWRRGGACLQPSLVVYVKRLLLLRLFIFNILV